jgi:DNA-binding PadR family transcriptional regulator
MKVKGERLGEFEELVLLTLAGMTDDESYVVPILERLEDEAERIVPIGAVYSALDRLHRKGMVRSWVAGGEKRGQGRRKRYYAVNEDGRAALDESRRIREHLWQSMLRATPERSPA